MRIKSFELDDLDHKLLLLLLKDARMSFKDMAGWLEVTSTTVIARHKRLQELGVLTGATINVDYRSLGFDIQALVGIVLEKNSRYADVIDWLKRVPEVTVAWHTTGLYGVMLQMVCRDATHLQDILFRKIESIGGVQRTELFLCLEEAFQRPLSMRLAPGANDLELEDLNERAFEV